VQEGYRRGELTGEINKITYEWRRRRRRKNKILEEEI